MKTALTIGFFDGVHLGHQAILRRLRQCPHATILTFSNHPQSLFHPPPPPLILPFEEKITRLKLYADEVLAIPFTFEFAATPYDELLSRFELSHLIFGIGSAFGKNREGDETQVRKYAQKKGIVVEYIPKVLFEGEPISSSRIRRALQSGQIHLAQQLLGTP